MLLRVALFRLFYGRVVFHRICVLPFFIPPSVDGRLGCFRARAVVSSAAVNVRVACVFLNSSLGRVYAQEWGRWIISQLCV